MKLYEIDQAIEALVDPDTGELLDYERFAELNMEREQKLEHMALWYKDLTAEAAKIRAEEVALAERRKAMERRADGLKKYLGMLLCGEKFETPRVAISWRKSESVEFDADFVNWAMTSGNDALLTYKAPEPNKTEIKRFLKAGGECPHAEIVAKNNLGVK